MAGTSQAEKEHLGLDSGITVGGGNRASMGPQKRWRYLGHPSQMNNVGVKDKDAFEHLKTAMRKLEFPRDEIAHMCEILAAILHIGQLEFMSSQSTTPAPDESGGYGHEGGEEVTVVKNKDVLTMIAAFLGVGDRVLEQSLGYRTKILHRERVTIMLDPKGARENADELARTLYSLLVAFIMERINQKICAVEDSIANTISIVDFPGFAHLSSTGSVLDHLLANAATESLYHFCLQSFFERKADLLETEEVSVPTTSYFDNGDAVKGLLKPGNGLLSILDDQMRRGKTDIQFADTLRRRFDKNPAIETTAAETRIPGSNFSTPNPDQKFTVTHFAGVVEYPVEGLLEENGEVISGDLMNLVNSSTSSFVSELFGQEALNKVVHPNDRTAVQQASVASKPSRMPSMARRKGGRGGTRRDVQDEDRASDEGGSRSFTRFNKPSDAQQGAAAQFLSSLDNITKSLSAPNTNPYFFFCLKPNDRRIANQFDSKCVRLQIRTLGIPEICQRIKNADYSIFMPFGEFLGTAEGEVTVVGSEREKAEMILDEKSWPTNEARVGVTGVFLSERCWRQIVHLGDMTELPLPYSDETPYNNSGLLTPMDAKRGFGDSRVNLLQTPGSGNYLDDKAAGYFSSHDLDSKSEAGVSAYRDGDMFRNLETREQMAEKGNDTAAVEIPDRPASGSRVRWLVVVYFLTWWIPDWAIRIIGRVPRKDVRMAWREKVAINFIIWLSCAFVIFFMIGFPRLICPTQHVFSPSELTSYNGEDSDAYIAIRGVVFDLGSYIPSHYPRIIPDKSLEKYAGTDATNLFPVQVSAMCQGKSATEPIDPAVQLNYRNYNYTDQNLVSTTDTNAQYHSTLR